MKKPPLAVSCVFEENGEEAGAIVLRSYRLYLRRRLEENMRAAPDCGDEKGTFYSGIDEFRQK